MGPLPQRSNAGTPALLCSIIVPVYNGAGVLARTLDALAAQTLPAACFEIIVVDDGSTDGTAQVARNWIKSHPGIQVRLVVQANAWQGAARNHGARLAQAPLLLCTDADCVPAPGWAAAFVEAFRSPAAPDVAMGAYTCAQPRPAAQFAQLEFAERYALMARHAAIDLVATYSAAYKRDVFLAAGGFDETLPNNEDTEFSYRLSKAGKRIMFVPAAQVQHEHDASWGDYVRTKIGRGYWRMQVYRRYPDKAGRDTYTPQVMKAQMALAPLALLALFLALITRKRRPLVGALPFALSTLPLLRLGVRLRSPAAIWVPWGSLLRALAFDWGVGQALLERLMGQDRQVQPAPAPQGAFAAAPEEAA